MAKQTRTQKNTQVQHSSGKGFQHEQTEVFDDNMLPEASEIKSLAEIDPTILDWLKKRAEKEQDFRHGAFNTKAQIVEQENTREHQVNIIGLVLAFLIIIGGMAFSTFLIYKDNLITGTVFSGLTILYAAALFINKRKQILPNKQ
jgi:uncharacterized membrane protein